MKIIFILIIFITGCSSIKNTPPKTINFTDIVNKEILDGFYHGDTILAKQSNAYFIKCK